MDDSRPVSRRKWVGGLVVAALGIGLAGFALRARERGNEPITPASSHVENAGPPREGSLASGAREPVILAVPAPVEAISAGIETNSAATLAGIVVDEGDSPLAAWYVRAATPERHQTWWMETQTDANGRFLLEDCPQERFHVAVYPPGEWSLEPALVLRDFELGDMELVLRVSDEMRASAWIRGRLVGPDGSPPSAARIVSRTEGGMFAPGIEHDDIDEEGRFRVGPFRVGAQRLEVSATDLASRSVDVEKLTAGEERDLGVIELEEPGALVVHLARSDGQPVDEYVWITADPIGRVGRQSVDLADGVGRTSTLAPGAWVVRAQGKEFATAQATVHVRAGAETRVDLRLEPGTARAVLIAPPAGVTLERAQIKVIDDAGETMFDHVYDFPPDEPTSVGVLGLRVGSYRVIVSTDAGLSGEAELVVETLELVFEPLTLELR